MVRSQIDIPPAIARQFLQDLRAFLKERDAIKRDEIAARQLHALNEYRRPRERKLRLSDVKELFELMKADLR